MKKLFLFLGAALFSLGVSAQELYEVTVSSWDFQLGDKAENNVEIQNQLPTLLKAGDFIHLTVKGYFDTPIAGVGVTCVVDNSGETMMEDPEHPGVEIPNYWIQLSEWKTEKMMKETPAKTLFEEETYIELTADATSTKKIILRMSPLTEDETVTAIKMRPTAEFKEGNKYDAELPTIKFVDDGTGTNYKAEFPFVTESPLAVDDIVKVYVEGVFSQDVEGLNFMIFDKAGKEVMGWTARAFSATKGEKASGVFEFTITKDVEGTENKIGVFVAGYNSENVLSYLKDGDEAHDPVDLGTKEFTNLTLSATKWETGSNYQSTDFDIVAPDGGFFSGDFFNFSIKGVASQEINGLQAVLVDADGNAVSSYKPLITEKIEKDGSVDITGKIEVSTATQVCKLRFNTTDAVVDEFETIVIAKASDTPDAIEEIATPSLEVVGGMVYSAGEIVVYNVAGKAIATASQSFNVNTLEAGVYFITAQEGTIKFVK